MHATFFCVLLDTDPDLIYIYFQVDQIIYGRNGSEAQIASMVITPGDQLLLSVNWI